MTSDPICCLPNDTVTKAAQIMRSEDVGPVPVVANFHDRSLLGIVTDRDLAIKVVSEGRDPNTTIIENVMTRDPITVHADDFLEEALQIMAGRQIRRVCVVDNDGLLIGIISQADVAMLGDDDQVSDLVEEISEPRGIGHGIRSAFGLGGRRGAEAAGNGLLMSACCMAFGAALMFMADPNRGKSRRARIRDKAARYYRQGSEFARKTQRDLTNRASGLAAQARSLGRDDDVSDDRLVLRARSAMGRIVSHPHAVAISAADGRLTVEGPILHNEAGTLLRYLESIPGVRGVDDRLELHDHKDIPELQGGADRPGIRNEFLQRNWSPAARTVAGAVGGGLALYGLSSRTPVGLATGAIGLGLLARGVTNREMGSVLPVRQARARFSRSREESPAHPELA